MISCRNFESPMEFILMFSLFASALHLILSPSSEKFPSHPLIFFSWFCCAILTLYFHKVFTENSKCGMEMEEIKERKSNIEHSLGAECVFFRDPLLFTLRIFCS